MKNLFLTVLALAVVLTSCKHEDTINPEQPGKNATTPEDAKMKTNDLALIEKYMLKKHSGKTLTYTDGKLSKIASTPGGFNHFVTNYFYKTLRSKTDLEIKVSVYDNGQPEKKSSDATYLVNLTTGLCYESTHQAYALPGNLNPPADLSLKTWSYTYNSNGQLLKRWNKSNPLECLKYFYDIHHDLTRVITYNAAGAAVKEIKFGYAQPAWQPMVKNLHPLYIELADLPDVYLKVFGKSSEHLVTRVTRVPLAGIQSAPYDKMYTYSRYADGYVYMESRSTVGDNSFSEYHVFEY